MELLLGIILIGMSIVHVIYGEKNLVIVLKKLTKDDLLIGSFRAMSLQGGLLLFAVGTVYLLVFFNLIILNGAAAYFPVGIVLLNVVAVLFIAMIKHPLLLSATIPQLIIVAVILSLQLLLLG